MVLVLSDSEAYDEQPSISFTSLGLLVLDEIRLPRQEPLTDVLGGSGAYGWFFVQYESVDERLTRSYSFARCSIVSSYSAGSLPWLDDEYWE
jgi:hypothetical protein